MFLAEDLKHGLRVLVKNPGFTLVAGAVLALGIGVNSAIFTVVNAALLQPLPFKDSDRLVKVWHVPPAKSFPGMTTFWVSPANYLDWRAQNHVFQQMAVYGYTDFNLTGAGQPIAVESAAVSADFFPLLGVEPILGRVFSADEDQPGRSNVVILGHGFWQTHFASDRGIIGKKIMLDGQGYEVIGVMGPQAVFPEPAKIWTPMAWTGEERAVRGNHNYHVLARLKPGMDLKQAQAEMNTISKRLEEQYPTDNAGWGATVVPLRDQLVGEVKPALRVLLGAVAFVLLIACANVANLMLAKTLGRRKEVAIRVVLGASRRRIIQQVLAESMLLASMGGIVGLALARFGATFIVAFLANRLPRSTEVKFDGWVLGFTIGVTLLTGALAGIVPAWRLAQTNLNEALKQGLGRTDSDSSATGTRGILVACEVALSLLLLVGAGLMIRSLWLLQKVDPGVDPQNVLTMSVVIPGAKYTQPLQQYGFYDQLIQRVQALPGVESAGAVSSLPLTVWGTTQPITIEGQPMLPLSEQPEVAIRQITPGYLRAMRIPLRQGRAFSEDDVPDRPAVVLISESMASKFWPNENPIGKHLIMSFFPKVSREIVGVVGDVKQRGLDVREPTQTLYVPLAQMPRTWMALAVRTRSQPNGELAEITTVVHEVDPEVPITEVSTMEEIMATSMSQKRFNMLLLGAFAGLALVLAAVGIYSVLSYTVRRRTREIGTRMALGAQIGDVLKMVVFEGMRPPALGILVGLVGAFALSRIVANLVYGVKPTDPLTFGAVAVILGTVALLACILPAYRAAKTEPMKALRDE